MLSVSSVKSNLSLFFTGFYLVFATPGLPQSNISPWEICSHIERGEGEEGKEKKSVNQSLMADLSFEDIFLNLKIITNRTVYKLLIDFCNSCM